MERFLPPSLKLVIVNDLIIDELEVVRGNGEQQRHIERLENINFVQNGDVVLFEGAMGTTSGIYWNGGLFAPTMEGVRFVDEQHSNITAAWRV